MLSAAAAAARSLRPRRSVSSFHGRPLPPVCVGFSSEEGKRRFAEALAAGDAEAFFPLAEQFITQDAPAFCGIASLCMVLNALRVDPGPTRPAWREDGVWRWFDESVLDLSAPVMLANSKTTLTQIKAVGVTLDEFASLAEHNGASVKMYRPKDSSEAHFRTQLIHASRVHAAPHVVVAFSRKTLMQTGDGHFSPVAGYHADTDSVLVLDVARFKYPPYWVPISLLWEAMWPIDEDTGTYRGFVMLDAKATCPVWDAWKHEQDRQAHLELTRQVRPNVT